MGLSKLPSKLGREPLIDVIFELRFKTAVPASNVLPGALFATLGAGSVLPVERLPASQLPEVMRKADPLLRHAPLLTMEWELFNVLIGDEAIALGCNLPYPGWSSFKPAIVKVVDAVMKIGIIQGVERYSLKYVDLLPVAGLEGQIRSLNWDVRVGNHQLRSEIAALRIEVLRDSFLHLINVQTGAVVSLKDGRTLHGLAIDVDTIYRAATSSDAAEFAVDLPDRLEALHASNKSMFFECLTPETLQMLEPSYE